MIARGFVGGLFVLVGGLLVAVLPPSTALLQLDLLREVRATTTGRMIGLAVVLLGLGLLAAAWLRLCRYAARAAAAEQGEAVDLVRYATVVWSAPLLLAPPLFSRDGWSYAAQGMLARLDLSPYEHGPSVLSGPVVEAVDPRWLDTPAPYGPLPLLLGDLAARLTGNPWMLVIGHRTMALLGLVMLAWAVPRMARWTGRSPAFATALVLPSPLMLANGVAGLHNDLLMVGLMASALVVAVERGWAWAAVLGGLAAAVKLPGGLVCIAVALATLPAGAAHADRLRRLVAVAGVAVGALVGLGIAAGLGAGWVAALGVPGTVRTPLSLPTVFGGLLDRLAAGAGIGAEGDLLTLVRACAALAALGLAGWWSLRRPTGDRVEAVRLAGLLAGALVVLGPVVHLWYFLWPLPFLATLPAGRSATAALVAASVVLGLVAPLNSSLHGAYLAILFGSAMVAGLLLVLLATGAARKRLRWIAEAEWLPVGDSSAGPRIG